MATFDTAQIPDVVNEDERQTTQTFMPPAGRDEHHTDHNGSHDINLLGDVEVTATVELGRAQMLVRDVLKLHRGSVIELDKLVGQPADLLINNTMVAKGEVIVLNERLGFRVSKFISINES